MFLRGAIRNKRARDRYKTFSVILLLFLYVAGNVQMESFHQVFHSLEKSLHSYEQEKDPCHRAIYHDTDAGCDHKTHVTAVKKCPLCHIVPFNEQHFLIRNTFETISVPNDFGDYPVEIQTPGIDINLAARAPPKS